MVEEEAEAAGVNDGDDAAPTEQTTQAAPTAQPRASQNQCQQPRSEGSKQGTATKRRKKAKKLTGMEVNPSVEAFPGDCGPNETIRRPVRKKSNNKQYLKALPTSMKSVSARGFCESNDLPAPKGDFGSFHVYEGTFNGHGVAITCQPDMNWLHYQGCFGKGVLSKSEPNYHRKLRGIRLGYHQRLTPSEQIQMKRERREEGQRKGKQPKNSRLLSKAAQDAEDPEKTTIEAPSLPLQSTEGAVHSGPADVGVEATTAGVQREGKRKHDSCDAQQVVAQVNTNEDTFVSQEHLQLSLVEAFYLMYGLDCLRILCPTQAREMSLLECWRVFCSAQPNFIERYATYHHLRSRGWIPKSGLKFAVDFLAYRQGPAYYHSSFSVSVETAWEDTLEPWSSSHTRNSAKWQRAISLARMSGQAGKENVTCTVLRPRTLTDEQLCSPECIKLFKVLQVLQRRWLPSKARH